MADLRVLKIQVQRQLKCSLEQASAYFGREFEQPAVTYTVKGAKAGVAYLRENEIRLNPVLLAENGADFIQQTVPHELAHLLVYQLFGRVQPHGKEWKMMMEEVLGVPAEVYHCYDLAKVRQTFAYQCACQTHQLTIRRHKAIVEGKAIYHCRKCKQVLEVQDKT
ncbi:SprT family protein [Pasteurellaceae bacterium RH1A]|nr:SprT family protein [Pasteurellaceae bacterium RH1A]